VGAEKVAAVLMNLFHKWPPTSATRIEMIHCNNTPGVVAYTGDHLAGVFLIEIFDSKIITDVGQGEAHLPRTRPREWAVATGLLGVLYATSFLTLPAVEDFMHQNATELGWIAE
jgi:hypothetical protein